MLFEKSRGASKNKKPQEENGAGRGLPYIASGIFSRAPSGYLNYCTFSVLGTDSAGRRRRLKIDTLSESAAREIAAGCGISEPEAVLCEPRTPTPDQLEYALDLGITVPDGACEEDVSCMISRVTDDDANIPSTDAAVYADHKGLHFSAWIGERAFYNMLYSKLGRRDKLTFFAYAVCCYLTSRAPGNPDADENAERFERFADEFISDEAVVSSAESYGGEELIAFGTYGGRTRTAAYSAAARYVLGFIENAPSEQ